MSHTCRPFRKPGATDRRFRALAAVLVVFCAMSVLGSADAQVDEAKKDLEEAKEAAQEATAVMDEVLTKQERIDDEVLVLEQRIAVAAADVEVLRAEASQVMIDRYTGQGAALGAFESDDLNRSEIENAISEIVQRNRLDSVDEYRVVQQDLDDARTELAEREAEAAEVTELVEFAMATLDAEVARLDELVVIEEKKEAERVARAKAAIAAGRPPAQADTPIGPIVTGGAFICPVQGGVSFVDSWGFARSGGRSHQGTDMMAANGTPVVAPVSGTVTHKGNSLGGMSFYLDGDDGNWYYGTHMSAYGNAGYVQAGTVVGYVGATGNARGGSPHLHFEIHVGGRGNARNPYSTVRAAC